MIYCSSGYDRLIIRPNGDISRCYSKYDPISNFNNDILKIRQCDQINCGICDKSNSLIFNDHNLIKIKKRTLNIQLVVTERCYHFCPYCTHCDRSEKYNYPIKAIPMKHFVDFLNKIDVPNNVIIIGGEPTIRSDLQELFESNCNSFAMFSACLYSNKITDIINSMNNYKNKHLAIVPTIHPYAKNYNWDIFWENVSKLKSCKNIQIPRIHVLDYKIDNIIDSIKNKCNKMKIKLIIKGTDYSVASERVSKQAQIKKINKFITLPSIVKFNKI